MRRRRGRGRPRAAGAGAGGVLTRRACRFFTTGTACHGSGRQLGWQPGGGKLDEGTPLSGGGGLWGEGGGLSGERGGTLSGEGASRGNRLGGRSGRR